jgi:hypothetical protein
MLIHWDIKGFFWNIGRIFMAWLTTFLIEVRWCGAAYLATTIGLMRMTSV